MPSFSAMRSSFTPAVGVGTWCNWSLDAGVTASTFGKIISISWGGQLTTSTAYNTRWARPTAVGTGARTNITPGAYDPQPNYTAAGLAAVLSYATTQPTLPAVGAGDLWNQSWNAQGGVGIMVMPLANPWWLINGGLTGALSCINTTGVDANGSSYGVMWEE